MTSGAGEGQEDSAAAEPATDKAWLREQQSWEMDKAAWQNEYELRKSVHDARLEVSKGAIERGRSGAEFVRNASGAIVTLYTGVLALTFAADETRLPARGIIPALFLALSVVFATSYVAWLGRAPQTMAPVPHSSLAEYQERRLNAFSRWASALALDRARSLHAAVLALGAGVLFLPTPFLAVNDDATWAVALLAMVLAVGAPFVDVRSTGSQEPSESPKG